MTKGITLRQAIALFCATPKAKNNSDLVKKLKRALKLIAMGFNPDLTEMKTQAFESFCITTTVDQLKDAIAIFDRVFDAAVAAGQVSVNTRRTYRWPLCQFLLWMEKQIWYQELFPEPIDKPMPPYKGVQRNSEPRIRIPYAVKEEQLLAPQAQELNDFRIFWTKPGREAKRMRRGAEPVRNSTCERVKIQAILSFYGYCIHQGYKPEELSLKLMTDMDLVEKCIDWLVDFRGCTHSIGIRMSQTAISVAKFLVQTQSGNQILGRQRRNWSDISVVEDFRDLSKECQDDYRKQKKRNEENKWADKELSHQEARQVVHYLMMYRSLCYANKRGRHLSAVWWDWQRYLGVKFLVYSPVRQEELRQLEFGKTLFRRVDASGNPYYEVRYPPDKHKNGSKTHRSRHYRLPSVLTQDLDDWLNEWRPKIEVALQSLDNWLAFWNHDSEKMDRLHQTLLDAKQGKVHKNVKVSTEQYILNLEKKIKALQQRINSWEVAKANCASHSCVFLMLGSRKHPESFGKPFDEENFWSMITNAVGFATQALFDEPRWTNPHGFRHIADKQVRKTNRGQQSTFDRFIGHSEQMGDAYAEQIMSEFELTEGVVDNWWEENELA
jgi:hypothetical protein